MSEVVNLGSIFNRFSSGKTIKSSDIFEVGEYPVFGGNGIRGFCDFYNFEGECLIIGRQGANCGNVRYFSGKAYMTEHAIIGVANEHQNVGYIANKLSLMKLEQFQGQSAQPGLSVQTLSEIPIQVPEKSVQDKVFSLLLILDQKIAINNQINEELEAMAKTLYDYWFVQFDFPDENGKPYKSSGGKMVYNDQLKREIPEGWGVDSLWNIATFYNGLAMQKFRPASETDESLPVIKIREMFSGFSKDTEKASTTIPKEAIIEAGDILFSWSATLEVILWGGEKGALNQHIFKVTSEKYPKSFIYNELRSYLKVFKTIAELRKTTMGHITQDHLKQAMIIVPPNDLIDEIHNRISLILKQQLDLKQQNQELSQLRDWLLPMLMNGLVKVD
ncbi:TPA: restriction endonuclease subunit S [Streptococcus suis]